MLRQHTCCIIRPTRIAVGRQFLGGLDLFFPQECADGSLWHRDISAPNNMPHNTKLFFFKLACHFGDRFAALPEFKIKKKSTTLFFFAPPAPSPLIETTFRLFHFKMYRSLYQLPLCFFEKPPFLFCRVCEIVQPPNLQRSPRSLALRAY